jgi:hypothetical protein
LSWTSVIVKRIAKPHDFTPNLMKKILALIALTTIGLTVGIGYFYWQRATALPEWITEKPDPTPSSNPETPSPTPEVSTPPPRTASTIQDQLQKTKPGPVQEKLTAAEVDNLIIAGLTKTNGSKGLPPAVKSIKTQIQQNRIRTGAIVDLGEIENMPPSPRTEIMGKLVKAMPQLKGKPVYIGVVGQLLIKDGQPRLSPDSKLQIGQLELPLDDVAKQLGVSRSSLEENVTNYVQFSNLSIENIDLTDQGATITGQKKHLKK